MTNSRYADKTECIVLAVFALYCGLLGAAMMTLPEPWFAATPNVTHTGPSNTHLIRDVSIIYMTMALAAVWSLRKPAVMVPAMGVCVIWMAGHAVLHFVGMVGDPHGLASALADILGVILPTGAIGWLIWRRRAT